MNTIILDSPQVCYKLHSHNGDMKRAPYYLSLGRETEIERGSLSVQSHPEA